MCSYECQSNTFLLDTKEDIDPGSFNLMAILSVNSQQCRTVQDRQCSTVNKKECSTVNMQECRTEQVQECSNVPEQQCTTVNEQECSTVPSQQCNTVMETVCDSQAQSGGGWLRRLWRRWRRIWRAQGLKQQQRKVQQQQKAELEAVEARGRGLPGPEGEPKVRWKAIRGPLGKRRKGRPELGDRYQEQQVHQLQV